MVNEIVLFEAKDKNIILPVQVSNDSVWLNRNQIAELFDRDIKTIGKHIANALKEELEPATVANFATVQNEGGREVKRNVQFYNLDMIISVGYRVKSQRGVEFRRWANSVLKQYIMQGYAANQKRLADLGKVVRLLKRIEHSLDAHQVLAVVEKYSEALDLLDSYDHQNMLRPKGNAAHYVLLMRNAATSLRNYGLEMNPLFSEKRRTIRSREASEISISPSTARTYTLHWRKRLPIYCIS